MPRKKKETSAKPVRAKKKVTAPRAKSGTSKARKSTRKVAPPGKVRSAKAAPVAAERSFHPPHLPRFGQTQLVAFVRDPRCVFTYWEVTPERIQEVKRELKEEFKGSSMVLRVFKVSPQGERQFLFEIDVEPGQMNHYVQLPEPVANHYLEIAQKTRSGRYMVYARSNNLGSAQLAGSVFSGSISIAANSSAAMARYYEEQGYREPSRGFSGPSSAENQKGKASAYSASHQ